MSNKRPLTTEEQAMADRMKAIIASTPGLTEESVANAVGVSQGQVSHWTGGRLPVPARRARAVADALGIADPAEISVAYRELSQGLPRTDRKNTETQAVDLKVSHAPRFDLRMIGNAAWALGEAFAAKGLPFRLENHQEYFLQVYQACLDLVDLKTPGHTAKILDLARELADKAGGERDGRGDQVPSTGIHQENMARRVRRKRR